MALACLHGDHSGACSSRSRQNEALEQGLAQQLQRCRVVVEGKGSCGQRKARQVLVRMHCCWCRLRTACSCHLRDCVALVSLGCLLASAGVLGNRVHFTWTLLKDLRLLGEFRKTWFHQVGGTLSPSGES